MGSASRGSAFRGRIRHSGLLPPRCPSARHSCHHLGHRSRRRCHHWLWAVAHRPCHGRLSLRLQPAPTSSPIVVHECHQDARPGVHLLSLGLLQLIAVRHQRRTTSTLAVGAERCRPPGHRRPSVWPHHTSVMAAALAASPSAHPVQDFGAGISIACWSSSRVPCWRLLSSVGRWSSPTAVQLQWHAEAVRATKA